MIRTLESMGHVLNHVSGRNGSQLIITLASWKSHFTIYKYIFSEWTNNNFFSFIKRSKKILYISRVKSIWNIYIFFLHFTKKKNLHYSEMQLGCFNYFWRWKIYEISWGFIKFVCRPERPYDETCGVTLYNA